VNPLATNSVAAPDEVVTAPLVVAEPEVWDTETDGMVAVGLEGAIEEEEPPLRVLRVLRGSDGATMLAEEEFEATDVVTEPV